MALEHANARVRSSSGDGFVDGVVICHPSHVGSVTRASRGTCGGEPGWGVSRSARMPEFLGDRTLARSFRMCADPSTETVIRKQEKGEEPGDRHFAFESISLSPSLSHSLYLFLFLFVSASLPTPYVLSFSR